MNKLERMALENRIEDLEKQIAGIKQSLSNEPDEIPEGQLCWFWDDDRGQEIGPDNPYAWLDFYAKKDDGLEHPHSVIHGVSWRNAKPVTPDEYEKMMPMFPEGQIIPKSTLYDWSNIDAPYKYMARDDDGRIYAYKNYPIWDCVKKEWISVGDDNTPGNFQFQGTIANSPINPKDSLEGRPEMKDGKNSNVEKTVGGICFDKKRISKILPSPFAGTENLQEFKMESKDNKTFFFHRRKK